MTQLYCDFDAPRLPAGLLEWITQCCRVWQWPLRAIRYDRTRRGWHVIVTVARRVPYDRVVAAQAIWGSDRRREMFNLMRASALRRMSSFWAARANVLYDTHWRGVRVFHHRSHQWR